MMQTCSAQSYLGKRVRFSAWMKTKEAGGGGAHLWLRVDGVDNSRLQFDNMNKRPVKGTTGWRRYSIVLEVPSNSKALAYGFFLSGNGQAWVSGAAFEEAGPGEIETRI